MDVDKYYKQLEAEGHSTEKCNLHFCWDWDELPVCKCAPEYECCNCFGEE